MATARKPASRRSAPKKPVSKPRARAQRSSLRAMRVPLLEQRQLDLVGLGLVALGVFLAFPIYLGWDGGAAGHAATRGVAYLVGQVGYGVPAAVVCAGAILVLRPVLPAVRPFRAGALCLFAALTLALAAGTFGARPARPSRRLLGRAVLRGPRRDRRRRAAVRRRDGLLDDRRAHPRRLPLRRRRPAADGRDGLRGPARDRLDARRHDARAEPRRPGSPGPRAARAGRSPPRSPHPRHAASPCARPSPTRARSSCARRTSRHRRSTARRATRTSSARRSTRPISSSTTTSKPAISPRPRSSPTRTTRCPRPTRPPPRSASSAR